MYFSNAAVNGLCAPSPSAAVDPALAAKAISVSDESGSTSRQAAPERARRAHALHLLGKGIVAAGVEDDEAQPPGRLENPDDPLERHGLVVDVEVALEHGVDGQQIVGAADLDAVAGVIHDRNVGIARGVGEVPDHPAHRAAAQVVLRFHDVEARGAEQRGDGAGVFLRIGQRPDVGIVRIADDQRDALFGKRIGQQQQGRQQPEDQGLQRVHVRLPNIVSQSIVSVSPRFGSD